MHGNSSLVVSNQKQIHSDLIKVLSRYRSTTYAKPIADFSKNAFLLALDSFYSSGFKNLYLDYGAGTGESSVNLARENKNVFVIGIDKSEVRTSKAEILSKKESLDNLLVIRADAIDCILLAEQNKVKVDMQFIYYPNPWPKSQHLKRRWHGHPIFSSLLGLSSRIVLRTNWLIYAEEFLEALRFFGLKKSSIDELGQGMPPITAFEKKYFNSSQKLYQVLSFAK